MRGRGQALAACVSLRGQLRLSPVSTRLPQIVVGLNRGGVHLVPVSMALQLSFLMITWINPLLTALANRLALPPGFPELVELRERQAFLNSPPSASEGVASPSPPATVGLSCFYSSHSIPS